jgi:hypothetical protein
MVRSTIVFGTRRRCGDHFHVVYECPGCHEGGPAVGDETIFAGMCDETGEKYLVVTLRTIKLYRTSCIYFEVPTAAELISIHNLSLGCTGNSMSEIGFTEPARSPRLSTVSFFP